MTKKITIYVAQRYLHHELRLHYMNEHKTTSFQHVSFLTFRNFMELYLRTPKKNVMIQQIELMQTLSTQHFPIFSTVLKTPSFIAELQSVMNTLIMNDCTIANLPDTYPSHQELKQILQLMQDTQRFQADDDCACMNEILMLPELSHVCFVNFSPSNQVEASFFHEAKQLGLQVQSHHSELKNKSYRYALNIRQEVEACAQDICVQLHEGHAIEDIRILVSDLAAYTPFVEHVFPRYNLPYFILNSTKPTSMKRLFRAIFSYYQTPSITTFLDLVTQPIFEVPHTQSLKTYTAFLAISHAQLFEEFGNVSKLTDAVHSQTRKKLQQLELEAQASQNHYLTLLDEVDASSMSTILLTYHQYLVKHQDNLSKTDIEYLQALRYQFQPLLDELDTMSIDMACAYGQSILESVRIEEERNTPSILISDIDHPYFPAELGYALGFNQKTYPNFRPLSGILNEQLVSLIEPFEPLAIRYHRHIKKCHDNLHFATNIIFSYPQGNFEGKVYESSLDLELQFAISKASAWPLMEHEYFQTVHHQLRPDLSSSLFFENNELLGSISKIEKYFQCPYAFFLSYGLKLKDPLRFSLMDAEIGDVYHSFFDSVVKEKQKQYTTVSDDYIHSFLRHQLTPYRQIFAEEEKMYQLMEEQLLYTIKQALTQLHRMEQYTSFQPTKTEYAFANLPITQHGGITLRLSGIIDRVDEIAHGFRVLDYKSSDRTLSMKKFYQGLSLQLITYTYILSKELAKTPFGGYYVSLKQPSLTHTAYSISRRSKAIMYHEEAAFLQDHQKQTKLNGLTYVDNEQDIILLDSSQSMITGLSCTAKGEIKVRNPQDAETIFEDLQLIYQQLIASLQEGSIPLEPVESACTYCSFKVICHFRGKPRKPKSLINPSASVESEEDL